MMDLTVNPDGLRADGAALTGSAEQTSTAAPCPPAASDTVSAHVADSLTAWTQALHALMAHAGQLRAAGGLALSGTSTDLQSVDDTNAQDIANVLDGSGTGPATPGAPSGALPQVPTPTLPAMPTMNPLVPMTGEQVAALVHAGPGSASLRSFAKHIRTTVAPAVMSTAQDVRNSSQSVRTNWDDGDTVAADKVGEHADWLETSLHPSFLSIADAADSAAAHTDTLIQNTPEPHEFTDLHRQLNVALANYQATGGKNADQVAAIKTELGTKQTTALASYQTYATAAPATTAGVQPPPPAPPIVHGPGTQVEKLTENGQKHDDGPGHGQDHQGKGPGDQDSPEPTDAPPGTPTGTPPANPAAAPAAADQAAPGMAANIAGMIMGAGAGVAGQVANSFHGLTGGGSPLSALSSLSSLPGMGGMPHLGTPPMPNGPGDSSPDGGVPDFGSGGTNPASGGGDGGGGGAPLSSSSPAVGPSVGTGITAGTSGTASPSGGGASGVGGMPMMPPMMGGMGGNNAEERKAEDKRRVVLRPVPNAEPVFGEVRRQTRRRAADPDKKTT